MGGRIRTSACFRSGEIRILDSIGNVERTIPFQRSGQKIVERAELYPGMETYCLNVQICDCIKITVSRTIRPESMSAE